MSEKPSASSRAELVAIFIDQAKKIPGFRLGNFTLRLAQKARVFFYHFLSTLHVEGRPILSQPLHAVGLGRLHIGTNVKIGCFPSPHYLTTCAYIEARMSTACITIGDGTWISNGFTALAEHSSINIGRNVFIGTNVEILDSNGHGLYVSERHMSKSEWAKPVYVEDEVFIGSNVVIVKGVRIGRGAIVANGSVVVKDVPSNVIVGGNPASIIRMLDSA